MCAVWAAAGCGLGQDAYLEVDLTASVCEQPAPDAMERTCLPVRPTGGLVRVYEGTAMIAEGNPEEGPWRVRLEPGDYEVVASAYFFGMAREEASVSAGSTTNLRLYLSSVDVTPR